MVSRGGVGKAREMTNDKTQEYYMKNELCFKVDENDQIITKLTKYDAHRIDPCTGVVPLHRAFSVFLLRPVGSPDIVQFELLLQQRSAEKLTFPLLWSNSCCSHPIDGLGEDTEDVVEGIVKAAQRKLDHELGIPSNLTSARTFFHYNRILYFANDNPWGEHELDHIILMEADEELVNSIKINLKEVNCIKFVPISDLHSQLNLTPWMQKILKSNLLNGWIEDFKDQSKKSDHVDAGNEFIKTKYSNEPIIKL